MQKIFGLFFIVLMKLSLLSASGFQNREEQINPSQAPTYNNSNYPRVSINSQGEAIVVWQDVVTLTQDSYLGNIYASIRDTEGHWSETFRINSQATANISSWAQVSMNDSKEIVVVWYVLDDNALNIFAKTRNSSGVWSNEFQVNNTAIDNGPAQESDFSIAMNNKGEIIICWSAFSGAYSNVYARSRNSSGHWSNVFQVNANNNANNDTPNVSINQLGEAIIVWGTPGALMESSRNTSGVWTRGTVTDEVFAPFQPKVKLNDSGLAVICVNILESVTPSVFSIRVFSKGPKQNTWSSTTLSSEDDLIGLIAQPRIDLNNSGEAVVVWSYVTESNIAIVASTRNTQGLWSKKTPISKENILSLTADAAINDSGEIVVTWWSSLRQVYANVRSSSGYWLGEFRVNKLPSTQKKSVYSKVALNDAGQVVIPWFTQVASDFQGNIYALIGFLRNLPQNEAEQLFLLNNTRNVIRPQKK